MLDQIPSQVVPIPLAAQIRTVLVARCASLRAEADQIDNLVANLAGYKMEEQKAPSVPLKQKTPFVPPKDEPIAREQAPIPAGVSVANNLDVVVSGTGLDTDEGNG